MKILKKLREEVVEAAETVEEPVAEESTEEVAEVESTEAADESTQEEKAK